mmetsp:Transcript_18291/g.42691  ORF Transcript_18291/g.42691 Transcript_18291/m.42691 type:complete len:224 (+) Transcript_18291:8429-9100(+)
MLKLALAARRVERLPLRTTCPSRFVQASSSLGLTTPSRSKCPSSHRTWPTLQLYLKPRLSPGQILVRTFCASTCAEKVLYQRLHWKAPPNPGTTKVTSSSPPQKRRCQRRWRHHQPRRTKSLWSLQGRLCSLATTSPSHLHPLSCSRRRCSALLSRIQAPLRHRMLGVLMVQLPAPSSSPLPQEPSSQRARRSLRCALPPLSARSLIATCAVCGLSTERQNHC